MTSDGFCHELPIGVQNPDVLPLEALSYRHSSTIDVDPGVVRLTYTDDTPTNAHGAGGFHPGRNQQGGYASQRRLASEFALI